MPRLFFLYAMIGVAILAIIPSSVLYVLHVRDAAYFRRQGWNGALTHSSEILRRTAFHRAVFGLGFLAMALTSVVDAWRPALGFVVGYVILLNGAINAFGAMHDYKDRRRAEGYRNIEALSKGVEAIAAFESGKLAGQDIGRVQGADAANKRTDALAKRAGEQPTDVTLVPGHKVVDDVIKPPKK